MSQTEQKHRELLRPPEIKPVVTFLLMAICMVNTGDPKYQWLQQHTLNPNKFLEALHNSDLVALFNMSFTAAFAQLGTVSFLLNILFLWIFGSRVEKKMPGWRYLAFILSGIILSWLILGYDTGFTAAKTFIGPSMLLSFIAGAYLALSPKKPFKPTEWKKVPWKIFTDDKESRTVQIPWVSPWFYVTLFALYLFLAQSLLALTQQKITEITHLSFLAAAHRALIGDAGTGSLAFMTPVAAVEAAIAGYFVSHLLLSLVMKHKLKRSAGDLQIQTVLQYKELRALDMTHKQAVDGAAKLIGVPEDTAKEWITQGLQPIKDSHET